MFRQRLTSHSMINCSKIDCVWVCVRWTQPAAQCAIRIRQAMVAHTITNRAHRKEKRTSQKKAYKTFLYIKCVMFAENPPGGGLRQHTVICVLVCMPYILLVRSPPPIFPQHTLRSSFLCFSRWLYRVHPSTFNWCFSCTRSNLHLARKQEKRVRCFVFDLVCETTRCCHCFGLLPKKYRILI